jgi:hypothetical protein
MKVLAGEQIMNATGIKITRFPYEEPYHLNLWIEASNGKMNGRLEYYCNADDLSELGNKLVGYLGNQDETIVYERGSEKPEDRFAFFFSLRVNPLDLAGHSVVRIRMNNNQPPPATEVCEFCIPVDVIDVNRLGSLLGAFGKLNHRVLDWSVKDGKLIKNVESLTD